MDSSPTCWLPTPVVATVRVPPRSQRSHHHPADYVVSLDVLTNDGNVLTALAEAGCDVEVPAGSATPSPPSSPLAAPPGTTSSSSPPGRLLGSTHRPDHLLVLHPGNPGVVFFYETFVTELQRRVQPPNSLAVAVVGFAGQSLTCDRNGRTVFELQEQIDVATDVVEMLLEHRRRLSKVDVDDNAGASRGVPRAGGLWGKSVRLSGHSIGAFIAMHVMARLGEEIAQTFMLTPTICNMAQSPNGRDVLKRVALAPLGTWVASSVAAPLLTALLPGWAKRGSFEQCRRS